MPKACACQFLKPEQIEPALVARLKRLNIIAQARGQTLAQMAIAWVLREKWITSALIGASRPEQIEDCVGALKAPPFSHDELALIEKELIA